MCLKDVFSWWADFFSIPTLEDFTHIAVIVGVVFAILTYLFNRKKVADEWEYEAAVSLDNQYLDFQKLCLENPKLNIYDIPDDSPVPLSPEEMKKELILFTTLTSIFERAFILYRNPEHSLKRNYWGVWENYIEHYSNRENYRDAWKEWRAHEKQQTWHEDFEAFMTKCIEKH